MAKKLAFSTLNALKLFVILYRETILTVTIHQPDFLPWLGFFDRWQKSDLFIILDDVQFIRRGWQHRDKIKTVHGIKWLTASVNKKGNYLSELRYIQLNNRLNWKKQHIDLIQHTYGQSKNFHNIFSSLEQIYHKKHTLLIDFNMDLLKFCAHELSIKTPTLMSSEQNIKSVGTRRLIDLIKTVKGDIYLTGLGSKNYLEEDIFQKEKIQIRWQQFDHPIYNQMYGSFEKNLSIIDYLFNK